MLPTRRSLREGRVKAVCAGLLACCLPAAFAWKAAPNPTYLYALWPLCLAAGALTYRWRWGRHRRRLEALRREFPPAWREFLLRRVAFYAALDAAGRERFERMTQVFLAEVPVAGVRVEIDDDTRLLVAASAVIPAFGFVEWEYDVLREVLIYPDEFDSSFGEEDYDEDIVSGMVETRGLAAGVMILSKPDLELAFSGHADSYNVGIHEFAHLVDQAAGDIDGVPAGLPHGSFGPWLKVVHEEMLAGGRSDIDPYGFTDEGEFFAVASEYFFENPARLAKRHAELYDLLRKIYRQDPQTLYGRMGKAKPGRKD